MRSSSTSALAVPLTRFSTIDNRAFPVAGAKTWNSLPSEVNHVFKVLANIED